MSECIDRAAAIEIAEKYGLTDGSVLGRHSGVGECIAKWIHTKTEEDDWDTAFIIGIVPLAGGLKVQIQRVLGNIALAVGQKWKES